MIEGISGKACNLLVSDWFRGGRLGTWGFVPGSGEPSLADAVY